MPRDFKTILCGTDFSPRADQALAYALRFATLADGTLIVAHFVHVPGGDVYDGGKHWPRTFAEAQERSHAKLEEVRRTQLRDYPKVELVVDVGAPAAQLIALARARAVDVIVTASHGRSELADLLIGSTAEKLIRHAPCPVFVVRPDAS